MCVCVCVCTCVCVCLCGTFQHYTWQPATTSVTNLLSTALSVLSLNFVPYKKIRKYHEILISDHAQTHITRIQSYEDVVVNTHLRWWVGIGHTSVAMGYSITNDKRTLM